VPFCPQCREEYRPGFARCADCDVDLVDALPEEPKPEEPRIREHLRALKRVFATSSMAEAEVVRILLRDHGIEAVVEGGAMGLQAFEAGRAPLGVRVQEDDFPRAQDLVRRFLEERDEKRKAREKPAPGPSPMGRTGTERIVWFAAFCVWALVVFAFVMPGSGGEVSRLVAIAAIVLPLVVLAALRMFRKRPRRPTEVDSPD
jgi:hypothetical protein